MANVLRSFIHGWRVAARLWPVVGVVYLVDTAFALAITIPPASQLSAVFGHSTLAPELSGPISLDWLIELQEGADLSGFPWLLYLLIPLTSVLVTTFLRGGILGALAGEKGTALRWSTFLSNCIRYFWRLLLLLLFIVPVFLVVILISLLTLRIGFSPGSGGLDLAPAIGRGVLLGVLAFLVPTILDYARVSLVLDPGRSIFRHFGRGLRFVVIRFPVVLLLGLSFWALAVAIAAFSPAILTLSTIQIGFIGAFVPQQISVALASWQRVAMLGGEITLFVTSSRKERMEGREGTEGM